MRKLILPAAVLLFLGACNKDKFTTEPQIEFKSIDGAFVDGTRPISSLDPEPGAILNLRITDKEGDLGITDKDTAFVYVKSLLTGQMDSMVFPDLKAVAKKEFKAELATALIPKKRANPGMNEVIDTIYYEVYVKDFKKNKSNVIKTQDPVFFKYR